MFFYNELCYLFQKPKFLQWIIHCAAGSHFETFSALGSRAKPSWFEPSRAKPSQTEPSWRRPARHIFQKHNVLPWILHFYTPCTKHQFLPWIWRLCYKHMHFYNEFDRPLQINSNSCKNTMFYDELCTCFKNLIF